MYNFISIVTIIISILLKPSRETEDLILGSWDQMIKNTKDIITIYM